MSDIVGASNSKHFKKQKINKASSDEIIKIKDMECVYMKNDTHPQMPPLHNYGLTVTKHIWFDPLLDPTIVHLKKPTKSSFGDVAFTFYAAHPENKTYTLMPLQHSIIRTGFAVNAGLAENFSVFGDYPNWCATLHGLRKLESVGIHTGTSIIRPHDHREVQVSLFNFGRESVEIKCMDPVVELLFAACHSPDIASCHRSIDGCYDG
jgi:dUTPase